jgi:hypothetical protein
MGRFGMVRATLLATTVLLLTGAAAAHAATPPFYAVDLHHAQLPAGVQPWLPTYTPDGSRIVFRDQVAGHVWTTADDGSKPACVTCSFTHEPDIHGGFTYAFPGGKRLFMSTQELGQTGGGDDLLSPDAWVLECAPSIVRCTTHRFVPVDMSADKGGSFIIQRRTWHLAPDGVHLGWMDLRLDGTAMVVATLQRQADRYVAADPRVVNPAGPTGPADTNAEHWSNGLQLYELKSFADGGRSILAVAEPSYNTDVLKIDLKTGRTTRLTANKEWDEDGAISPDDGSYVVNSLRTRDRLTAAAWIPQLRSFQALGFGAAFAPYYVSTWGGFQCDLSPWLLPASGDDGGRLTGQPLDVYAGNLTAGNNLGGQQVWSPDSTSVVLQERLRTKPGAGANPAVAQKGLVPNRLTIAEIAKPATKPGAVRSSTVGAWAPAARDWRGTIAANRTVTIPGPKGGSAVLSLSGNLQTTATTATYRHYSEDGKTFVDGTMTITGSAPWHVVAAIKVTGAHTGSLDADMTIDNSITAAHPVPTKTGRYVAVYDGKTAPPLPTVGPCYSRLPKPNALRLTLARAGGTVRATVRANIAGDARPVQGAVVRLAGRTATTDRHGRATLRTTAGGTATATAGPTFTPARVRLR